MPIFTNQDDIPSELCQDAAPKVKCPTFILHGQADEAGEAWPRRISYILNNNSNDDNDNHQDDDNHDDDHHHRHDSDRMLSKCSIYIS